jgi:hypothetical protein
LVVEGEVGAVCGRVAGVEHVLEWSVLRVGVLVKFSMVDDRRSRGSGGFNTFKLTDVEDDYAPELGSLARERGLRNDLHCSM